MQAALLIQAFERFGLALSAEEIAPYRDFAPAEAILMLLAEREIAARFDSAHGHPPEQSDLEALADYYETLARSSGSD
jgi:hypothetical protein